MRIALIQKRAAPNHVKRNLDLAVRYMEEAEEDEGILTVDFPMDEIRTYRKEEPFIRKKLRTEKEES
nr:hypothetical protein [uncultured Sellimonas sp.]